MQILKDVLDIKDVLVKASSQILIIIFSGKLVEFSLLIRLYIIK